MGDKLKIIMHQMSLFFKKGVQVSAPHMFVAVYQLEMSRNETFIPMELHWVVKTYVPYCKAASATLKPFRQFEEVHFPYLCLLDLREPWPHTKP